MLLTGPYISINYLSNRNGTKAFLKTYLKSPMTRNLYSDMYLEKRFSRTFRTAQVKIRHCLTTVPATENITINLGMVVFYQTQYLLYKNMIPLLPRCWPICSASFRWNLVSCCVFMLRWKLENRYTGLFCHLDNLFFLVIF